MSDLTHTQLEALKEYTLEDLDCDARFTRFIESSRTAIAIVPEEYGEPRCFAHKAGSGSFGKWIRLHKPQIDVVIIPAHQQIELRSSDFWLPLVYLTQDIALPVYINIASDYIAEKMRNALKGDNPTIHIKAEYQDQKSGTIKRFAFKGDHDALKAVIKKFDINEFMKLK